MFAPPLANTPTSAAYPYPHAHSRRRSQSWDPEAGLPPPPSEIDAYGNNLPLLPNRAVSPGPVPDNMSAWGDEPYSERDMDKRQQPMNAVSKHPKVKLDLVLSSTTFEAGGTISGRLELTSATSQRLRLGEIAVELEGIEELSSRDHSASQVFLYNRTLFQGSSLPPSNAVLPSAPISGYWTARKGRTTFPFSFKLPPSAPSSVVFGGNASLRYALKATTQIWWNDSKSIVTSRRDAFVVERWADENDEKYREPVEAVADTRLFLGGSGAVWLEAGVAEQLFWGGGQVLIRAGVKNKTKKAVSGIKVSIARKLIFPVAPENEPARREPRSLEPQITDIVHTQTFKGPSFEFPPNEEIATTLAVDLPRDVRTIRKTRLFEVRIFVIISLHLGTFAKDLSTEVPIYVAHTASIQRAAQPNLSPLHPQHANFRPGSAAGHHPHFALPDRPHTSMGNMMRSPSAPPINAPVFDPAAIAQAGGWSASQFLASTNFVAPIPPYGQGAPDRPHSAMGFAPPMRAVSVGPDMMAPHQMQHLPQGHPQQAWAQHASPVPPQRSMSVSPGMGMGGPPPHHAYDASRRVSAPDGTQRSWLAPMPEPQTIRAAPTTPKPTPIRATPSPQPSRQLPSPQSRIQQQQQQQPSVVMSSVSPSHLANTQQQPRSTFSSPSPDPASFEQQPAQPIPLPLSAFLGANNGPPPPQGLATIEEDSESQAGTIRSIRGLNALLKSVPSGPGGTLNAPTNGTLGGSVTREDIGNFERFAEEAEDAEMEERQREEMRKMGMHVDEGAFANGAPGTKGKAEIDDKSLPRPPVPSTKSAVAPVANGAPSALERATLNAASRPRASDIFNAAQAQTKSVASPRQEDSGTVKAAAGAVPTPASKSVHAALTSPSRLDAPSTPDSRLRRDSTGSNGVGLGALESRLASPAPQEVTVMANVKPDTSASSYSSPARPETRERKDSSALRAAAQAALQKEELAKKEARSSVASGVQHGKKTVDEREQRELNKQAVSRVTGWLGGSGGISDSGRAEVNNVRPFDAEVDLPPIPSPSVIASGLHVAADDDDALDRSASVRKPTSSAVTAAAAYAGLKSASAPSGMVAADAPPPTLSKELRALVDNAEPLSKRRTGTAIQQHPMTRRLSSGGGTDSKEPTPSGLSLGPNKSYTGVPRRSSGMPTASTFDRLNSGNLSDEESEALTRSRRAKELEKAQEESGQGGDEDEADIVVPSRMARTLLATPAGSKAAGAGVSAAQGGLLLSSDATPSKKGYDARSQRGGRGGRVTSVAQLWANIADGEQSAVPVSTSSKSVGSARSSTAAATPKAAPPKPKPSAPPVAAKTFKRGDDVKALKSGEAKGYLNTSSTGTPVFAKEAVTSTIPAEVVVERARVDSAPTLPSSKPARRSYIPPSVRSASGTTSSLSKASSVVLSRSKSPSVSPSALSKPSIALSTRTGAESSLSAEPAARTDSQRSVSPFDSGSRGFANASVHPHSAAALRNSRRQTVDFLARPPASTSSSVEDAAAAPSSISRASGGSGVVEQSVKRYVSATTASDKIDDTVQRHASGVGAASINAPPSGLAAPSTSSPSLAGRGTTKPIGKDKIAHLKNIWGG